jgi:hypothetical protein
MWKIRNLRVLAQTPEGMDYMDCLDYTDYMDQMDHREEAMGSADQNSSSPCRRPAPRL